MFAEKVAPFCFLAAVGTLAVAVTDKLTVADRDPRPATVQSGVWHAPDDVRSANEWTLTVTDDGTGSSLSLPADRDAAAEARRGDRVTVVTRRGAFGLSEERRVRAAR